MAMAREEALCCGLNSIGQYKALMSGEAYKQLAAIFVWC